MASSGRLLNIAGGLLAGLLLLSVGAGVANDLRDGSPSEPTLAFEAVLALGGVFGVLTLFGFFREGRALVLASVGMTAIVATGLGLVGQGMGPGEVLRHWLFLIRVCLAGLLLAVVAGEVLNRRPSSWRSAMVGVGFLVIAAVVFAVIYFGRQQLGASGVAQFASMVLTLGGGLVAAISLSLGVHGIVEGLESSRGEVAPDEKAPEATPTTGSD